MEMFFLFKIYWYNINIMIPIRDDNPYKTKPYMTWFIIIASIGIFIFQMSLPYEEMEALLISYGFIPAELHSIINDGNFSILGNVAASIFACMFLHGSWAHLLGNMWSLWLFGDNVEDKIGKFNFLFFYLLSGFAASGVHYFVNMNSEIPVIGASGAIAGVMGAYVLMFPLARIVTLVPIVWIPLFFHIPAFVFIGLWFFLQVFLGVSELGLTQVAGGVAWWAHIGGFLFGAIMVRLYKRGD
ncbi:MAG: rhomboid family intramembrane serine protease [Eubacteriales bacterium]|nr:rhomboid family intramembrane serine protease [Eubacteriales bacterium]